jgi:hypothetical protein
MRHTHLLVLLDELAGLEAAQVAPVRLDHDRHVAHDARLLADHVVAVHPVHDVDRDLALVRHMPLPALQ